MVVLWFSGKGSFFYRFFEWFCVFPDCDVSAKSYCVWRPHIYYVVIHLNTFFECGKIRNWNTALQFCKNRQFLLCRSSLLVQRENSVRFFFFIEFSWNKHFLVKRFMQISRIGMEALCRIKNKNVMAVDIEMRFHFTLNRLHILISIKRFTLRHIWWNWIWYVMHIIYQIKLQTHCV